MRPVRIGVTVKLLLQFGEGLAHPGLQHARIDPNGVRNLVPGLRPIRRSTRAAAHRRPNSEATALGPTSISRLPKSKRGIFFSTSSNSSCSGLFSSSSAMAAIASTLPALRAASWMADAICAAFSAAACSSLFLMRSPPVALCARVPRVNQIVRGRPNKAIRAFAERVGHVDRTPSAPPQFSRRPF